MKFPPKFIAISLVIFLIISTACLGAGYFYLSQDIFFNPASNYTIDRQSRG